MDLAETTFKDQPGIWPKLKLILRQLGGLMLAIVTLGLSVPALGGFQAYNDRFFKEHSIEKAWTQSDIKTQLKKSI